MDQPDPRQRPARGNGHLAGLRAGRSRQRRYEGNGRRPRGGSGHSPLPPAADELVRGPVPVPGGAETRLERLRSFASLLTLGAAPVLARRRGPRPSVYSDLAAVFAGAIGIVFGAWVQLVVRAELAAGKVQRAVGAICLGLIVGSLLLVVVLPEASRAVIVVPLLGVGIGLPYLDQRSLLRLMIGTTVAVTLITAAAEIAPQGVRTAARPACHRPGRRRRAGDGDGHAAALGVQHAAARGVGADVAGQRRTAPRRGARRHGQRGAAPPRRRTGAAVARDSASWRSWATCCRRAKRPRRPTPSSPRPPGRCSAATAACCSS